jgi:16S rRNA processing protein RimM
VSPRLEVGRVGRAHGLRGEVAVTFTTNRSERCEPGAVLYAGERRLVIATARPHQGRWLVCFDGIADRSAAEVLLGQRLFAAPLEGGDDELWVHELIGSEVRDPAGSVLGVVTSVEANPAHDLLVLEDGALVPVVFVREHGDDYVVVDVPDGLLEER